jgi:hypothetical protein
MFEELYEGIRAKLDALESGAQPAMADWRKTPIGHWDGGFVKEAERIARPQWWDKPASPAEQGLPDLLKRAGLGKLRDDKESENVHAGPPGPTAESVEAHQREEEKTTGHDETEYAQYLPEPGDDVRKWLEQLPVGVEIKAESKPWYDALRNYVLKFPKGTRAAEADAETIAKFVKVICQNAHATE